MEDLEADVKRLNRTDGSFLGPHHVGGLLARYGRDRVRTELLRQAMSCPPFEGSCIDAAGRTAYEERTP
jgi:hypothetical protein